MTFPPHFEITVRDVKANPLNETMSGAGTARKPKGQRRRTGPAAAGPEENNLCRS